MKQQLVEDLLAFGTILVMAGLVYVHAVTADAAVGVIGTALGYIFRGVRNGINGKVSPGGQ